MADTYWVVRILTGPGGTMLDPETIGPFTTDTVQLEVAEAMRDEIDESDFLFWLDVTDARPKLGIFDPQWWEEKR